MKNQKTMKKINATKVMWGYTNKAQLYDINGVQKWIPHALCTYSEKEEVLTIAEWFYKKLFPKKS